MRRAIAPLLSLAVQSCGGAADPTTADAAADVADATDVVVDGSGGADAGADASLPPAPTGTRVLFDLGAVGDDFFAFPWPADVRLDGDGTLDVLGLPNPRGQPLYEGLLASADHKRGVSQLPVAWFRFDGPVAERRLADVIVAAPNAPIVLLAIDPASHAFGTLVPTVASSLGVDDYVPANVLAVAALPGWVLEPSTRYAVVVRRDALDAAGAPLGTPEALWALAHGGDGALAEMFEGLWPALDAAGVARDSVAAATVFTTGDEVGALARLSDAIVAERDATITELAVDAEGGADHARYCALRGTIELPQFQRGTPPFNTGGTFELDVAGDPVAQRWERVPNVITLPKAPMPPSGFPLTLYVHGSGGDSAQVVERGPDGTRGQGPAHVLAAHGIAAASAAMPVNPERLPGASSFAYLNLSNLAAFPDTFRQGVIEQRLTIEALGALEITPSTVAACPEITLPAGARTLRFSRDRLSVMGQSMGGMYTNMIGAVEPLVAAVVPTGAGGYWSYFILETNLIPGAGVLLARLIGTDQLSFVHPVLHVLQTAWEPAEPFVYVPRIAARPLEGHVSRSIYEPVGEGDSYFPTSTYDAIALAFRNPQAGDVVWPGMQEWLAFRSLDGLRSYPVSSNLTSAGGEPYTGAVVQFPGDGVHDPHEIFQYDDAVKYQYGCFLASFVATGIATIPAPAPLGTPCPGLPD